MGTTRTAWALVGLILAVLLLFPSVLGVGFANPPRDREIVFQPGQTVEVPIYVVGADSIRVTVGSPTKGDPSTLGTPEDNNILEHARIDDPAPLTGQRRVILIVTFPESMAPGLYSLDVTSAEVTPGNVGIVARAAMKLRFEVRVLTDEKLLEATRLRVTSVPEGLDAQATVDIVSRTTTPIDSAYAKIYVHNGDDVVATANSNSLPLASGEKNTLSATLPVAHLIGGAYKVNATVHYDEGKEARSPRATLNIGTLKIDVVQYTRELLYNSTNKFTFRIENQWNREIRNVEATLKLGEQAKQTARQSIPAFKKAPYEVYFDRDPRIKQGQATINVTVNYQDYDPESNSYISATDTVPISVNVILPAVEEKPSLPGSMIAMYSLLGLLVILLAAVLLILLKRKKHEDPPPEEPL